MQGYLRNQMNIMKRLEILSKLHKFKENNQGKYQFTKIGIFGSVARDNAGKQSDIDIVVELQKPDLFTLGSIKTDLEDEFGTKVDIIRLHKKMNSFLKKRIDQEAIYV